MFEIGANVLKLRDDCLQFGVYLARVASLVLLVIAQRAHSPDQTFQRRGDLIALHWYASIYVAYVATSPHGGGTRGQGGSGAENDTPGRAPSPGATQEDLKKI